ncbi:MAG: hypothetical protein KGJ41_02715 [Rhodospirillales bacterium]|nr:hypothetical protein [Rhodospirillales bacterium]
MIGDQGDMLARLKAVLPPRWFADDAPVLDAVLSGFAATAAWLFQMLAGVRQQARIASATGPFLDMAAVDYFGASVVRKIAQGDAAFRLRIQRELVRERGTRVAIIAMLTDLTGRAPMVFEPSRPADTGGWGAGVAYGAAGGWGSLALPFQCFVTAFRPKGAGISVIGGWGSGAGGYGEGALKYASLSMLQGQVTDADINAAIVEVLPTNVVAWTRISN